MSEDKTHGHPVLKETYGHQGGVGGHSILPFSPAIRAGDLVFVSGQVPVGENGEVVAGGIVPQTRQVFSNIEKVLNLANCSLTDIVKTTVFLTDTRDFSAFNDAYQTCLAALDMPPARSTIKADLMIDMKVEIEVIAYKPL